MIGETVDNKEFTYKDYKRKLSHIESSFPIWMMSEKKKRRRIYVLDNKYSNQIWDIEPLNSIRKIKEIYFIEVNDLNNQNGDRLNVHKEGNCINLTDCPQIINEKIKMLDSVYEKQMMINLLMDYHDKDIEKQKIVGSILKDDCVEINEEEIDNVLLKLIEKLIKQYDIKPASEELCE